MTSDYGMLRHQLIRFSINCRANNHHEEICTKIINPFSTKGSLQNIFFLLHSGGGGRFCFYKCQYVCKVSCDSNTVQSETLEKKHPNFFVPQDSLSRIFPKPYHNVPVLYYT